ncbi:MAG: carboxypeptidase-like regulatory domain-containing protein [Gemmatimonadaceae bacterium]|nr:carboxypeptidase-like regulatory domain-containing protein [Gemmatimonadaceae bacterium]
MKMREKLLIERGHFLPLVCGLLACVLQLVTREAHAQGNVVITGVVVSQSAQPVAAAVVRVTQEGGRATAADTTDSNGRYTLSRVLKNR